MPRKRARESLATTRLTEDRAMSTAPTVLLDLDGTLVDTCPDLLDALNNVIRPYGGTDMTRDVFQPFIGRGARHMIERALATEEIRLEPEMMDSVHAAFLEHYERRIARLSRPYPGAVAAIDRMRADGARFAVCTNKLEGLARRLVDELGLAGRLDAVAGPDTYGAAKPDPAMLLRTIEAVGGTAACAVMVGDSRFDLEAARNAGLPFIGVSFGYTETPMAALDPDVLIDSFEALPDAVVALLPRR